MSNFLVTGGAGFIGSNTVRALHDLGHHIRVIDDLSTGFMTNLDSVINDIEFINADISDFSSIKHHFKDMDFVIHLAAWRAVGRSVDNPLNAHAVNSTGIINVLQSAHEAKVKKVVFISSSSVYGDGTSGQSKETDRLFPESPYAVAKLSGEHYCSVYSKLFGLPTVSLRLFNVYGPGSRADALYAPVIPIFLKNLLQNIPPTVDWHGRQSRDFVHVTDVVKAIIMSIENISVGNGDVFNIGDGKTTSINDLLASLQRVVGTSLTPKHNPKREGDVLITYADTTHAERKLGFRPTISLGDGLKSSIDWYKEYVQNEIKIHAEKTL